MGSTNKFPLFANFPHISKIHYWVLYEIVRLFVGTTLSCAMRFGLVFGSAFGAVDLAKDGLSTRFIASFFIVFVVVSIVYWLVSNLQELMILGSSGRIAGHTRFLLNQLGEGATALELDSVDAAKSESRPIHLMRQRSTWTRLLPAVMGIPFVLFVPEPWRFLGVIVVVVTVLVALRRHTGSFR